VWVAALVGVSLAMGCGSRAAGSGSRAATRPRPAPRSSPGDAVDAELERLVASGATRAAVVVLDPRDGRLLAAAGRGPDGDYEASRELPMGSTIKPLTVAAALEAGLDPRERFDGEGGRWQADARTSLRDYRPHGSLTVEQVLVTSSNIGAGKIVQRVGEAPIAALFDRVGARVPDEGSWMTHGAGIDVRMSALRLAVAYGALANGGFAIQPTTSGRGARRRILSEPTATAVRDMLGAAVSDEGTGRRARIVGIPVGGKTGTTGDGAAVFAGIAPLNAPRFVIVVRVEQEGAVGGAVAAPAFARIAAHLL